MKKLPTYFISHGGGPWPWMQEAQTSYAKLLYSLQELPKQYEAPKAILVITAHWEEKIFAIQANAKPPMIYDYGGFPTHTYKIQYSAPGSPELAQKILQILQDKKIPAKLDQERGFDHGTFTPLYAIYPKADIPIVQLSILENYNPAKHLELGHALSPLREEGILIIGSGLSYHNLRNFGVGAKSSSKEFDTWLQNAVLQKNIPMRTKQLLDWEKAPSARSAHPREDHLVPLFVALGAAEEENATLIYHEDDFVGGVSVSSFRFGN